MEDALYLGRVLDVSQSETRPGARLELLCNVRLDDRDGWSMHLRFLCEHISVVSFSRIVNWDVIVYYIKALLLFHTTCQEVED
jgi:hypothetical protein